MKETIVQVVEKHLKMSDSPGDVEHQQRQQQQGHEVQDDEVEDEEGGLGDEDANDSEGDTVYYYDTQFDTDCQDMNQKEVDPESYDVEVFDKEEVTTFLEQTIDKVAKSVKSFTPPEVKILLMCHAWNVNRVIELGEKDSDRSLIEVNLKPKSVIPFSCTSTHPQDNECGICLEPFEVPPVRTSKLMAGRTTPSSTGSSSSSSPSFSYSSSSESCATTTPFNSLPCIPCGHRFCVPCWRQHLKHNVRKGCALSCECMAHGCRIRLPEPISLSLLIDPTERIRFQEVSLREQVSTHPNLRSCPGPNCCRFIRCKEPPAPKRVVCTMCNFMFCFGCCLPYHAPTSCDTIRRWMTKCADDSETANYISANTKDCPKCHTCIEKNGGCNHMQCFSCKHDFCWICLSDWRTHGTEYYECSVYKETQSTSSSSNLATSSNKEDLGPHAAAREALKKYLFYFERWDNHARSLRLEQQTLHKIKDKIHAQVMLSKGTWIDWQYLTEAAALLAKCRYTLQYTYPYAYYLEPGSRKVLFEYQQGQLEAEIENLSWKIERSETTDRGDLKNHMDIAEKRRITLLNEFVLDLPGS